MKKYFSTGWQTVCEALFKDKWNLFFSISMLIIFLADLFIWKIFLQKFDLYVITLSGIYPVKYLAIILFINLFLGIFSYSKEKEISYLLFSANVFLSLLVFILEIFYLLESYA